MMMHMIPERKDNTGSLKIERKILTDRENLCEYCYEITNTSEQDVYLEDFVLYQADNLEQMGLSADSCRCFRSGRHKNDMPTVFTFGAMDESMLDALDGMTETGDRQEENTGNHVIVSDHLTVLGNAGNYIMITFITGRNQLFATEISLDAEGKFVGLVSKVEFHIRLKAGQSVTTETIRIERTSDVEASIAAFAEDKAQRYGSRNAKNPSVYCTWYYYGLSVTYEDVLMNLREMQRRKLPFDVFQVDEGWEVTLGEWSPNEKFPVPMKEVAAQIREAGYIPGIWTSPFIAHETASIWQQHPEWLLKDTKGNPCLFPMNDTIYYILDITIPSTWEYFKELYQKLTFDWGYVYHKLDFTRAPIVAEDAVYADDTMTLAEAYYHAVAAIREGMGEEAYFLMCGGLYDPIIGLVDAQRTGSDVLSMWSSNINKDGKTAPYTIKQSILRYYMNRWWNNDPDALMVRKNETMERGLRLTYGLLNDEEVKTSVVNQFIGGGIVCSTEPLDKISDDRLYQLKHIMPVIRTKVQPVSVMNSGRFPENIRVDIETAESCCVARINWSDEEEMPVEFVLTEAFANACTGFKAGVCAEEQMNVTERYVVCDFYSGKYRTDVKVGDMVTFPALKPHGATVLKIEKQWEDKPMVVGSDGHYSMGAEISCLELRDGEVYLEYANPFECPIQYQILLPEGVNGQEKQEVVKVFVPGQNA